MENEREPTGRTPDPGADDTPRPDDARDDRSRPEDDLDLEVPEGSPDANHTALPPKIESWRRRSAAGAILTGFALGLQEALEKRKEDPSIVMETSGDPPRDLPVEAEFEYGRPRQSVVQIRPWLLPDPGAATGAEGEHPGAAPGNGEGDAAGPQSDQEA